MASASASGTSPSFLIRSDTSDNLSVPSHKRTYQACIPCRRRKVRCDLGPVDDPHEPPCVRCRRESKECYFSATRRKRKGEEDAEGGAEDIDDDYAARNQRRKITTTNSISPGSQKAILSYVQEATISNPPSATQSSRGYSLAENGTFPTSRARFRDSTVASEGSVQDQEVTNETAAALFQSPINNPGDALHLLLEASGRSEDLTFRGQQGNPDHEGILVSRSNYTAPQSGTRDTAKHQTQTDNIDPAISHDTNSSNSPTHVQDALKTWSRLRFVRAGWFTAAEAMSYVDYFFEYLAPLSPVSLPDFQLPAKQSTLTEEEPMLTVTILTIAARYKKLSGPGGQSRSFLIHERLWTYLQNMITRMFWGQEQFGGGFCGAGNRKGGRGRLRTLGTIESLLLLSDWHPRSMHFPPGDDGDEILVPLEEEQIVVSTLPNETLQSGKGRTIMAGWTEPALRSDRMCWSLAGASYTLACELGIFGNFDDETDSLNGDFAQASGSLAYRRRAVRVERLLYIYVTQTSGRLGFPSMLPGHVGITENFTNYEQAFLTEDIVTPQNMVETIQRCWAEVTSIMKAGNSQLFFSREKTRKLIQSGEYTELLDQLQPVLRSWQKNFESLDGDFYSADLSERRLIKTVPKYSRIVLSIEFEYMRIYTNSLALQAVLEQWTTKVGADMHNNPNNAPDQNIKFPGVILSSSLVEIYKKNECYIREVVDGSRSLLRYVVNDLFPNDYLKHAPVRTYFRILSGAMFLLKTFALGGKEEDVAISLRLLDETARALRTSVVDDVHLCLRIADLLKGLTSSIRHKFVRLVARSSINPQKANASPRKRQPEYQKYLDEARIKRREAEASSFNLPLPAMANTFGNNFSNNDNPVIGVATDNTITIMPPPDYLFTSTDYAFNPENLEPQPYDLFLPPHSSPQQHHFYSPTTTNTTNTTSSTLIPSSDWLTLDLNPLLDATQGMNGSLDQWDGSFGPEIHSNLDVLGRLVNEPYRVGEGYDLGGMGFS